MWVNPRFATEQQQPDRPQAPPEPAGPVLAALLRRSRDKPDQELRLILETFNGHPYLRLQLWEQGRDGWWPMRGRSVTVRMSEVADLADALAGALAEDRDGTPPPDARPGPAPTWRLRMWEMPNASRHPS
jgi:hypothetical protein